VTYVYNNPTHALHYGFDAPAVEEVRVLDENDIGKYVYTTVHHHATHHPNY